MDLHNLILHSLQGNFRQYNGEMIDFH